MGIWDYIIIGVVAAAVAGAVISIVISKKRGKSSCGCGNCADCGYNGSCASTKEKGDKQ
ncbi:MAG: FeoB-associated Cys-rich membrane protein [Clostridia bacterium]|nr:FeoB-associated Cys-rich membrane protein [Clostridia bacterium]